VPGVGEKTAAKLINTYGGLDGIFANVEQQTPKLRASLTEHEERVRKNLEMMVLSADAPLDGVDLGDLAIVPKPDEVSGCSSSSSSARSPIVSPRHWATARWRWRWVPSARSCTPRSPSSSPPPTRSS
jgi:DNA polymerase-1